MKRLALATCFALALAFAPGQSASASTPPDYKLKCRNGKVSKVWIDGDDLRAVNNCGKHSKQWLMLHAGNEDGSATTVYSIQPGASYEDSTKGWDGIQTEGDLYVHLGRGLFCSYDADPADDEYGFVRAVVIYRNGSTWKPSC